MTISTPANPGEIMETVVAKGDLAALTPDERARYYIKVCESMGLNPMTQPFQYIELDKKLTLYATRTATDQLRATRGISVRIISRETIDDVYVVTVEATDDHGRTDTSIGAVSLVKEDGEWKSSNSGKRYFQGNGVFKPLGPDDRANNYMRAETKAKRRVTLSICGLGFLDESEFDTIPSAKIAAAKVSPPSRAEQTALAPGELVDTGTGEITTTGAVIPSDSMRAAWTDEIKAAFAIWNRESAERIDAELAEHGEPWRYIPLIEFAPTPKVRASVIERALKAGVSQGAIDHVLSTIGAGS